MSDLDQRIADLSPEKRALLELRLKGKSVATTQVIPRRKAKRPCLLSFAQQRLWFLDQFVPDNPAYNVLRAFRLTGQLDVAVLEKCLDEIVRRHESLRTTFTTLEGQPAQVVTPPSTLRQVQGKLFPLTIVDLSDLPGPEREAEAQRLLTEESRWVFDLAQGPLVRIVLLRMNREEHIFLLVMHHIVSDGWSIGVLLQELAALYEAFAAGRPSPLLGLPIQYADFAAWQREWLEREVLETQLAYWEGQLEGVPVLELPTDRPRPSVQAYRGARQSLLLPRELSESLKALSRQEGVTLFMMLLAAFEVLLYRYTGQEDIAVGTPIANRNRVEIEGLIGFFVNTLVLRADLSGDPTFRGLLSRVREVALDSYAHQDLPFEKLVEELRPERNLSHAPLFQVGFGLQDAAGEGVALGEVAVEPVEVDNGTAKFDLTLLMVEEVEGLRGMLEYNTDLFDATTIERMAGHFHTLLEGIVTNLEQRIGTLPLLTEPERHQLLVAWNATQTEYPRDLCVHQRFEAQAARTPDRVAVVFEGQRLTYRELNQRANQLAHHLQSLGVGPDVLVGIYVERSLEMVVGILGILKAGGAYLPLDPAYPKERLAFMLEDTQAPVLLTQERLLGELPEHRAAVVCLDADREVTAQQSVENPSSGVTSGHLAYVIYTSGSTGRPKGVKIEHRSVVNTLEAMHRESGLTDADTLLSMTTLSFDISVPELFLPLVVGARVVIVSRTVAADGEQLARALVETGSTVMQGTPASWTLLLSAGWEGSDRLRALCGGEALPQGLAAQLVERMRSLWNLYGPTETTVWSTVYRVSSVDGPISIGRPIANTQIYLLDDHGRPAPIGVPGELYIGGDGVAQGYLNRPGLTAEKFIPDPFGEQPGARLYKTGDLARYLPDGNIQFLGRLDHQVKIRGFRIELGEIEAMLGQHPAMRETVVLAREDEPGDKRLVAYIVPDQEPVPTMEELQGYLRAKLPEYMVPSAFVFLDGMPLMPNGKVDRQALPAPERKRPELESAFAPPRTPTEELLAGVWTQVLGIEQVGIYDNFFELGGHSLLATRVVSRVRDAFQMELPLRCIFEAPTVAELSRVIKEVSAGHAEPRAPRIVPVERRAHRGKRSSTGMLIQVEKDS